MQPFGFFFPIDNFRYRHLLAAFCSSLSLLCPPMQSSHSHTTCIRLHIHCTLSLLFRVSCMPYTLASLCISQYLPCTCSLSSISLTLPACSLRSTNNLVVLSRIFCIRKSRPTLDIFLGGEQLVPSPVYLCKTCY